MPVIKLENISKTYPKGVKALDDFSFESFENELVVILGPSGSGKTTLLKIISGLDISYTGEIFFDDKKASELEIKDRELALVFQNYALYPQMSAYDNISIPLRQKNFYLKKLKRNGQEILSYDHEKVKELKKELINASKEDKLQLKNQIKEIKNIKDTPIYSYQRIKEEEIDERVEYYSEILEINSFLGQRVSTLSGGQKQRVALCKAVVKKPKILLLDEPLSNLDNKLKSKARELILKAHEASNCTTIVVSHLQEDAMVLANRVIVMNKGKIVQIGTPDEIYSNPNSLFVASFLGNPPINQIKCQFIKNKLIAVNDSHDELFIDDKIKNKMINEDFTFAIRPENIVIKEDGRYQGKVKRNELLGVDNFVHIDAFDMDLVIKNQKRCRENETVNFDMLDDGILLFDDHDLRV